jgi:hypothetical protein
MSRPPAFERYIPWLDGENADDYYRRIAPIRKDRELATKAFRERAALLFKLLKRAGFEYVRQGISYPELDDIAVAAYTDRRDYEDMASTHAFDLDLHLDDVMADTARAVIAAACESVGLAYRPDGWRFVIFGEHAVAHELADIERRLGEIDKVLTSGVSTSWSGEERELTDAARADWERSRTIVERQRDTLIIPDWAALRARELDELMAAALNDDAEWTERKRRTALRNMKDAALAALKYGATEHDLGNVIATARSMAAA